MDKECYNYANDLLVLVVTYQNPGNGVHIKIIKILYEDQSMGQNMIQSKAQWRKYGKKISLNY